MDFWKIWKRDTSDPMIRLFLDKYGMNLLALPRQDISVGDLFVYDTQNREVSSKGSIIYFLNPQPKIPPLTVGARMMDLSTSMTQNVDFKIGWGLLDTFLQAFNVGLLTGKIKSAYEAKKAKTIRFGFKNATKDSVDAMRLGKKFRNRKPIQDHPFYGRNNRYFLVMSVARTSSIAIIVEDDSKQQINIDFKVINEEIAEIGANFGKNRDAVATFKGKEKLGFAVELQELVYDSSEDRIFLKPMKEAIRLRGRAGPEKDVFINLK